MVFARLGIILFKQPDHPEPKGWLSTDSGGTTALTQKPKGEKKDEEGIDTDDYRHVFTAKYLSELCG